jgi:hypothetical protein
MRSANINDPFASNKKIETLLSLFSEQNQREQFASMLNRLGDVIYKKKNFYYDDILEKRAKILKRIHLAASREKAREKVKSKFLFYSSFFFKIKSLNF